MKILRAFFLLPVIVGALPNNIQNGQLEDAVPVMANFNWLVNQVNANAQPLGTAALLASANTFTLVQSGVAATSAANFPIASQVQNQTFNTLTSTLGTNTITARIAALALAQYSIGQVFTFIPSQTNTGPANITIDAAGSSIIFSGGSTLIGGELQAGVEMMIARDAVRFNVIGAPTFAKQGSNVVFAGPSATAATAVPAFRFLTPTDLPLNSTFLTGSSGLLVSNPNWLRNSLSADVTLNNTGTFFDGPTLANPATGVWLVFGQVTVVDTGSAVGMDLLITDGTTTFNSCEGVTTGGNSAMTLNLSAIVPNPAGSIKFQVKDKTATTGKILANQSGNGKDSSIYALRIG